MTCWIKNELCLRIRRVTPVIHGNKPDKESIDSLKRTIELKSDCVEGHEALGEALLKIGNRIGAMEQLQIVRELNPKYEDEFFNNLGSESPANKVAILIIPPLH